MEINEIKQEKTSAIHKIKNNVLGLSKFKKILYLTLIITIIIGSSILVYNASKKTDDRGVFISNGLKGINELSTVEHRYTFIGEFNDSHELDLSFTKLDVPFTNKHFVGFFEGVIKYGIDLSELGPAVINDEKKTIEISMPEVKRTGHQIDSETIRYYEENNNILNLITPEDGDKFKEDHMKEAEQQDIDEGVLEYVYSETEKSIKIFIAGVMPELKDYTVICEFPEQDTIEDSTTEYLIMSN